MADMIPTNLPECKMSSFVVPGSLIKMTHDFPYSEGAKSLTIKMADMDILLRDIGITGSKTIVEMDEDDKTSTYLDKISEGVNSNMIKLPGYFPRTACFVDTTGQVFLDEVESIPTDGYKAVTVPDQVRNAVLHKSCLVNDGANRDVLYDPRQKNVYNGISVLQDRATKTVENHIYRLVNVFIPENAKQMQELPEEELVTSTWTAEDTEDDEN